MNLNDYLYCLKNKNQRNKQKQIYYQNIYQNISQNISFNNSLESNDIKKQQKELINRTYLYDKSRNKMVSEINNKKINNFDIHPEKINLNYYDIKKKNNVNPSNYIKTSKVHNNYVKLNNQSYNILLNKKNKNNSILNFNDEVEYMNMKLNLKLLEHKLSKLTNIIIPEDEFKPKDINENNFNIDNIINIRNISYDKNSSNINNSNLKEENKKEENKLYKNKYNINNKNNDNNIDIQTKENINSINKGENNNLVQENSSFQINSLQQSNELNNKYINKNLDKNLEIMNSEEPFINNALYKYQNNQLQNELINIKNENRDNFNDVINKNDNIKEYPINNDIINDSENSDKKDNLNEKNNSNEKNINTEIENEKNNIKNERVDINIELKDINFPNNIDCNKIKNYNPDNNIEIEQNKDENLVNEKNNDGNIGDKEEKINNHNNTNEINISNDKINDKLLLSNRSNDEVEEGEEENLNISNGNKDLDIKNKDNNNLKNNKMKEYENIFQNENDKMNILLSQISPYKEIDQNLQLIPEKENKNLEKSIDNTHSNDISLETSNKSIKNKNKNLNILNKKNKKVTFDENLIYINYDEDEYVTNLLITDNNGRTIPYKEKEFSKYLRLLTSVSYTSKLKPSIIDLTGKNKKKKKTKIMKRNMEFIKEVEKTGNVYNTSKDRPKKIYKIDNMIGCKKFLENPQQFFTEELCDAVLLSYNLEPKEKPKTNRNNSNTK